MKKQGLILSALFVSFALLLAGCGGEDGATGPAGPAGATGPAMPVIQSISVSGSPVAPAGTVTASVNAQSAEGLVLTYSWTVSPTGWNIVSGETTTTVTITAPGTYAQAGAATVTVTDARARTATGVIALSTEKNEAPIIHSISASPGQVYRGDVITVSSSVTDPNNNSLAYSWTAPAGFTILSGAGTSSIRISPFTYAYGSVQLSVSDGNGGSATGAVSVGTLVNQWDGAWGAAGVIETDAGNALEPQIAAGPSGNAIAVWRQFDGTTWNIWSNRHVTGTGWGTAGLIETDNAGAAYNPQIAMDPSGNAIAVWYQSDGTRYNIYANRYAAGTGWGAAELIETNNAGGASDPQIAMDPSGNAIAVWYQSDGTRYNIWANRYAAGTGWGTATFIETDNAGDALYSQVAIDPSGNAIAVWQQFDGTRYNIWANRYAAGTGWGTTTLIETDDSGPASNPQVAMDPGGDAIAVWHQFDGTTWNVWSNRYVAGTGWGTATFIETDNAGDASSPQVAMDPSGNAIVVWQQYDGTQDNIYANRYMAGTGWGAATLIETDNAGGAQAPQIAMDPSGNAVAVWYQSDGTRTNIWANRYVAGSGWGTAGLIETDNAGGAVNPQIAMDPSGNAVAVWQHWDGSRNNIWANGFE